jgi:bacitracin synthase 3
MISRLFEEQAKRTPDKLAIQEGEFSLTYRQLNQYANGISFQIQQILKEDATPQAIALLLRNGRDMVASILGVLKSRHYYVPLSIGYPTERMNYMLTHSGASLLIAEKESMEKRLQNISVSIECLFLGKDRPEEKETDPSIKVAGDARAYILYTSGSTGFPKGVCQTHRAVLYYIRNWTRIFSITEEDQMTLFSSFCHDGSLQDMFGALLNGATLFPVDIKNREDCADLGEMINREKITIWHSVPSLFRYLVKTLTKYHQFPLVRYVLLGGEPIQDFEISHMDNYFPNSRRANVYGQTESSVNTVWEIPKQETVGNILLGDPLEETQVFVVDEEGAEVEEYETGELVVASPYISTGYWNNQSETEKVFDQDPEMGNLYWTGDWGRQLPGRQIQLLGRKDYQIKIRGFRVELGEIENQLMRIPSIAEAVVQAFQHQAGEPYLSAYVVNQGENSVPEIRETLASLLPDYMVPLLIIQMDSLPLTQSGKIDRALLPDPAIEKKIPVKGARNEIEHTLIRLWSEVLGVKENQVGIDHDFFEMGGHSLRATTLVSKIHKEFNTRLPVSLVFQECTVRGLARCIKKSKKNTYIPVKSYEEKEYYPVSAIQKRFFIINRMQGVKTAFNLPMVMHMEGEIDPKVLERAFENLIKRHVNLRSSFLLVDDIPVQRIHREVSFSFEKYAIQVDGEINGEHRNKIDAVIEAFIRPFDLVQAPLFRVGLITLSKRKHIFMYDLHHIISDGTSRGIFIRDFIHLYENQYLPELRVQYQDYCQWQISQEGREAFKKSEQYWMDIFGQGNFVPELDLFTDFPRPEMQSFQGDVIHFQLGKELTKAINTLAKKTNTTLFMVLLTIYNILLSRYSGKEDIVVGTAVAGRNHIDFHDIIGSFLNALAIRSYPVRDKTFREFLMEVKENTINAYDNQLYPFGELMERVGANRDISRNPLFDAEIFLQNMEMPAWSIKDLKLTPYTFDNKSSQVDIAIYVLEDDDRIHFYLLYCKELFKKTTMQRFLDFFREATRVVLDDVDIQLKDITLSHQLQSTKTNEYQSLRMNFDF